MRLEHKRSPVLEELDPMPFGKKYIGELIQDVPASYLEWCWQETNIKETHPSLYNHIYNNKEAIEKELGREI